MYLPCLKSQNLQAPASVDRSGRVDIERAVVHSASFTLQSRNPGRLSGRLQFVLWLLCMLPALVDVAHSIATSDVFVDAYSAMLVYTEHLLYI